MENTHIADLEAELLCFEPVCPDVGMLHFNTGEAL